MSDTPGASAARRRLLLCVLTAALVLTGCAGDIGKTDPDPAGPADRDTGTPADANNQELHPRDSQPDHFTIAAAGDVLIHDNVIDQASALAEGDGYAFAPLMAGVRDLIAGADLALCALEVPIAPEGVEPVGYPAFAAPPELAEGLSEVGFHGCSTANNHAFDQGIDGQERTLEVLEAAGLGHAGTARTAQEADRPQLYTLDRGGREVTVAHVATTMVHNEAYPPPGQEPWRVTDVSAEALTDLAAQARQDGADVVVASVHWGEEYVHEPTEEQRSYGEALAAGGEVDAVFGAHSHTPQPVERLDGGPGGEGMWVVWSMGNFLSNQDEACCAAETATGTVVYASVEVDDDAAEIAALDWLPVTVARGPTDEEPHRGVWPLRELAEGGIPEEVELSERTVRNRWVRILEVMSDQRLRGEPPTPTGEDPTAEPRSD